MVLSCQYIAIIEVDSLKVGMWRHRLHSRGEFHGVSLGVGRVSSWTSLWSSYSCSKWWNVCSGLCPKEPLFCLQCLSLTSVLWAVAKRFQQVSKHLKHLNPNSSINFRPSLELHNPEVLQPFHQGLIGFNIYGVLYPDSRVSAFSSEAACRWFTFIVMIFWNSVKYVEMSLLTRICLTPRAKFCAKFHLRVGNWTYFPL